MTDLLLLSPVATTVTLSPAQLDQVDVFDPDVVDEHLERIHVALGEHELVLEANSLTDAIDAARRILDRIEEATLDARQADLEAKRTTCPWCDFLIDPDEPDCGSRLCMSWSALDKAGRIP